ncbi:ATP-binding cassette domain-containing protein [Streptomyces bungoensis]|uniref:ATP-binding cassette domain-containing protein n=1 Tax=Streptomyces bungoensis TaxID=285568 RepID=UPI0036BB98B2
MIQAFGLTSNPRKAHPPAVDDVTFEACAGHVTALHGAAGAGKTTALRLMLELQRGRGVTYFRDRPLHRIPHPSREVGVLLGDVPGHPARSVRGHLRMLCAAAGVPVRRADEVLEVVGLVSFREERLGTLSRGMDRRLGLAGALLPDPHTLVLDAPTEGLSAREARWLHGMLRAHADQGGTVLFTTADPKEAARVADRVVTLDGGRLVADQPGKEFARTRLRPRVAVRSPQAARLAALLTKEARADRRSVEVVREGGNRLSVYGSTTADIGETAFRHGILVHQLADEVGAVGSAREAGSSDETGTAGETSTVGREQAAQGGSSGEQAQAVSGAVPEKVAAGRRAQALPTISCREQTRAGSLPGHTTLPDSVAVEETAQVDPAAGSDRMPLGIASEAGDAPPDSATGADGEPAADADHMSVGPCSEADGVPVGSGAGNDRTPAAPVRDADGSSADGLPAPSAATDVADTRPEPDSLTALVIAVGDRPAEAATQSDSAESSEVRARTGATGTSSGGTPAAGVTVPGARTPTALDPGSRSSGSGLRSRAGEARAIDALSDLPPPISVRPAPRPLRPLRYELRRAAGIGTGFLTCGAALVVSALTAVVLARLGHTPQARLFAAWPRELPLPPAALAAGLLGALAFGDEFRHPALAADRGTVPRRLGLLTAKLLVSGATAVMLAFLTMGCDAEVLYLVYGRELTEVPPDWLPLTAGWFGLLIGCSWAGVLAAGVFRSTTAGLAAVLAVPVLVVPVVHKVLRGPGPGAAAGLPARMRESFLLQWPFGGERYVAALARVVAQPVGGAMTLSLTALLCAYLYTTLRTRVR